MKIELEYGGFVIADSCSYCDVYLIDIDDDRIELNDVNHFVIGTIDHNNIYDNVEIIKYDKDGRLSENVITLCENGSNQKIQDMLNEKLLQIKTNILIGDNMNKKQALKLLIDLEIAHGEHKGRWENEYIQEDSSYRYFDDVTTIADICRVEYLHGDELDNKIEELENVTDCIEPYDEYGAEVKKNVEDKLINIILGDDDE